MTDLPHFPDSGSHLAAMSDPLDPLGRYDRHRRMACGLLPLVAGDPVLSHLTAATFHRLPLFRLALSYVQVTRRRGSSAKRHMTLHSHAARLDPDEIEEIDGVPVTSVDRTVVDCLRSVSVEAGVALADAALHRGLTDPVRLLESAGQQRRAPGVRRVLQVLSLTDPRCRGVGESRSRYVFHRSGLGLPRVHVPVPDRRGGVLGCAEFWFDTVGVVGALRDDPLTVRPACAHPQLTAARCAEAELPFVAWGWDELDQPELLRHAVEQAAYGPR